jgi:hypothetical protein
MLAMCSVRAWSKKINTLSSLHSIYDVPDDGHYCTVESWPPCTEYPERSSTEKGKISGHPSAVFMSTK